MDAGMGAVGSPCASNAECGGLKCDRAAPGGYCYADCTTAACPMGASCVGGGVDDDGSPIGKVCLKSCVAETDCRMGFACVDYGAQGKACAAKCTQDDDCPGGSCDLATGICITATSAVGNACADNAQCGANLTCAKSPTLPNGYCSRLCGADEPCPVGSVCVSAGDTGSACFKSCTSGADCQSVLHCVNNLCLAKCTMNSQCPAGKKCNTTTSVCVEAGPDARAIGAACTGNTACDSNTCQTAAMSMVAGGYCTQDCSNGGTCPTGSVCSNPGAGAECVYPCTSNGDCRDGWVCTSYGGPTGCFPQCSVSATFCVAGDVCAPDGVCRAPAAPPTVATTSMTGALFNAPHYQTGSSTVQTVTVPAGAVSLHLTLDGPASSNVKLMTLTGPSGLLFDQTDIGGSAMKVFNFPSSGTLSFMVPNSPDVALPAGNYQFEFASYKPNASAPVQLTSTVKTASAPNLTAGALDITFVFVGSHPVITNAAAAQADADFQQMVTNFKAVFATGGVTIGSIDYVDASAQVAADFADVPNNALGDLARTTSQLANDRLVVFWVQSLAGLLPGLTTLGQSTGVPGGIKRGYGTSAMAMSLLNFPNGNDNPTRMGRTLTHEFGHFLGLFHATERNGTSFDPLGDTAECDAATFDANNDKSMAPSECLTAGAANLMFWTQDTQAVARDKLSPNQKWVLLRHPAVK